MEATPGFQHSQHCLDLCVCTEVVCYQQQSGGNWEDAGGWAVSTHTAHTVIQHPQESDKVSLLEGDSHGISLTNQIAITLL